MIVISTQTFPPDRGGMEALMGGLADSLHAAGHKVMVFADRVHEANASVPEKPYPVLRFGGPRPLRRRSFPSCVYAWRAPKLTGPSP